MVCGGDNSTCERHQGAYNERATSVVMQHVVTIPAGATNVYIRQRSTAADDRGNLAADGNYIGETFLLRQECSRACVFPPRTTNNPAVD